jgi:hypothetical protein
MTYDFFSRIKPRQGPKSTLYTQAYHSQWFLIFLYNTMAHKYYKWLSHNGLIIDKTPQNSHLQARKQLTDMAPPRLVFYGCIHSTANIWEPDSTSNMTEIQASDTAGCSPHNRS